MSDFMVHVAALFVHRLLLRYNRAFRRRTGFAHPIRKAFLLPPDMITVLVARAFGVTRSEAAVLLWPISACFWGLAFNHIQNPRLRALYGLVMGLLCNCYCFGASSLIATVLPAIATYYLVHRYRGHHRLGPLATAAMLVYCVPL